MKKNRLVGRDRWARRIVACKHGRLGDPALRDLCGK
jgi:hypothetical protein